jgi:hypothetical protein
MLAVVRRAEIADVVDDGRPHAAHGARSPIQVASVTLHGTDAIRCE